MKNKIFQYSSAAGFLVLLLLGFSYPVRADEGKEKAATVKMSGEFRTRGFYTSDLVSPGTNGKDTEAFGDLRFRLKTTVTSGIATGVITADFVNGFCAPSVATVQSPLPLDGGAGGAFDAVSGCVKGTISTGNARFGTGTAFGHSLNIVGVREAYLIVRLKNFGAAAGRKHYVLGHGLVLDDMATGVAVRADLGSMRLTTADLNLADPNAALGLPGTSNDSDLYLIKLTDAPKDGMGYGKEKYSFYLGRLTDPKGNLTYGGFGRSSFGASGFAAQLNLIGASLKQYTYKEGGTVIDLEGNVFDGDIKGTAKTNISGISALASMSVPLGRGNVGLTMVYGSGQDPAKDPAVGGKLNINALSANYSLGNILLDTSMNSDRDGSSLSVGGRGIVAVKVSADCLKKEESRSLGIAIIWAKTAENASTTVASRNLGVELDGNASMKLDDNLQLTAGVGYLFAGDAWKVFKGDNNDAVKLHTAVVLTF
jgi:hypothetical protein